MRVLGGNRGVLVINFSAGWAVAEGRAGEGVEARIGIEVLSGGTGNLFHLEEGI